MKATSTSFKVMTKTIKEGEFCSFYYYPCCPIRTDINEKKHTLNTHYHPPHHARGREGYEKVKKDGE